MCSAMLYIHVPGCWRGVLIRCMDMVAVRSTHDHLVLHLLLHSLWTTLYFYTFLITLDMSILRRCRLAASHFKILNIYWRDYGVALSPARLVLKSEISSYIAEILPFRPFPLHHNICNSYPALENFAYNLTVARVSSSSSFLSSLSCHYVFLP